MATTPTTARFIKTRSTAAFALVVYRDSPLGVTAEIVGYAYSDSSAVIARARRLGARLLPINHVTHKVIL
jgi:hypothetical protein